MYTLPREIANLTFLYVNLVYTSAAPPHLMTSSHRSTFSWKLPLFGCGSQLDRNHGAWAARVQKVAQLGGLVASRGMGCMLRDRPIAAVFKAVPPTYTSNALEASHKQAGLTYRAKFMLALLYIDGNFSWRFEADSVP